MEQASTRTGPERVTTDTHDDRHRRRQRILPLVLLLSAAAGAALSVILAFVAPVAAATTTTTTTTLQATWVSLMPDAASATDGVPDGRCDHTFLRLDGASKRANAAFASLSAASADPYANQIWMYGGHQNDAYEDAWILDVAASPPVWSKLAYSGGVSPGQRWGTPTVLIPSGMDSSDVGLTAMMFAGADGATDGYRGDVSTLNFASNTVREITLMPASISDEVPFPRGYTNWFNLPVGFGTGYVAPNAPDSGSYYLLGGAGSRDGILYTTQDHDWNDEWIYNATSRTWQRLGELVCVANVTTCTDEMTLSSVLTNYTVENGGGAFNLAGVLRPSGIITAIDRLSNAITANAARTAALTDTPGACTTTCATYEPAAATSGETVLHPPPLEGVRLVTLGTKGYLFGGYLCLEKGAQTQGGDACFLSGMWVLDYATMRWNVTLPPDSSDPSFKLWPSKRCYNTLVAHESRGIIIVQGGFYQDNTGVGYYYSDSFAYDVALNTFVGFEVRGIPPLVQWSAGAALLGDDMWLFGGCQGSNYWDQLMVLRIGLAIVADNCFAFGDGLTSAVAGTPGSFSVQTREFVSSGIATTNASRVIFGADATYGTGLSARFSAQLVSSSSSGQLALLPTTVSEVGAGLYSISYTASVGRAYQVFVLFDALQIPGSPFALTLEPAAQVGAAQSTAQGLGVSQVEKGGLGVLLLQAADVHGNAFRDGSFLTPSNDTLEWQSADPATLQLAWPTSDGGNFTIAVAISFDLSGTTSAARVPFSARNWRNGSFSVSYRAPESSQFLLRVFTNGNDITGSPFAVEALDSIVLPPGIVAGLWAAALIIVALCVAGSVIVHVYRREPVMRSSSPNFLHLLIAGSSMMALSVLCFARENSDAACQAAHTLLSVGLVLGMAALLAKSHRVMRIFNAKQLKVQSNLSDSRLLVPVAAVTLAMLFINLLWIGVDPQRSEARASSSHPSVLSFQTCASPHGLQWVAAILCFCGLLLLYGVRIAVATSAVPDRFNESKLIAASVYNVFFCAVIVVPLTFFLGSSSEFVVGRLVLQSLVILWCSLFNVAALLAPKLSMVAQHRKASGSHAEGAMSEMPVSGAAAGTLAGGHIPASTAPGSRHRPTNSHQPHNHHSHHPANRRTSGAAPGGPSASAPRSALAFSAHRASFGAPQPVPGGVVYEFKVSSTKADEVGGTSPDKPDRYRPSGSPRDEGADIEPVSASRDVHVRTGSASVVPNRAWASSSAGAAHLPLPAGSPNAGSGSRAGSKAGSRQGSASQKRPAAAAHLRSADSASSVHRISTVSTAHVAPVLLTRAELAARKQNAARQSIEMASVASPSGGVASVSWIPSSMPASPEPTTGPGLQLQQQQQQPPHARRVSSALLDDEPESVTSRAGAESALSPGGAAFGPLPRSPSPPPPAHAHAAFKPSNIPGIMGRQASLDQRRPGSAADQPVFDVAAALDLPSPAPAPGAAAGQRNGQRVHSYATK